VGCLLRGGGGGLVGLGGGGGGGGGGPPPPPPDVGWGALELVGEEGCTPPVAWRKWAAGTAQHAWESAEAGVSMLMLKVLLLL
jgi:hypothetical protein